MLSVGLTSKYRESDKRADGSYAFESLSRFLQMTLQAAFLHEGTSWNWFRTGQASEFALRFAQQVRLPLGYNFMKYFKCESKKLKVRNYSYMFANEINQ